MIRQAKWIWLNKKDYPNIQRTTTWFAKDYADFSCRFAEFKKGFHFDKKIEKIVVEVSADVKYFLYVNDKYIGVGPVTPGGDYNSALPMPQQYYNTYEMPVDGTHVCVHALVQTLPIVQCDMTQGRNGFICACKIIFTDGSKKTFCSNETWLCRLHTAALKSSVFDYTKQEDEWQNAEIIPSVWNLLPSEIRNIEEEPIIPIGERALLVGAGRKRTAHFELDKIYSGYYTFAVEAKGEYQIDIYDYEKDENTKERRFTVKGNAGGMFRSVVMTSAGVFDIEVQNFGNSELTIKDITFTFQRFPYLS